MSDDTEPDAAGPTEATKLEGQGAPRKDDPAPAAHFAKGALVGRYVVLERIGEGGMGVVYSAFDPELDRKVAIKLLQATVGGSLSGGEQAWLVREAQALARLAHPNVVGVHDVGTLPGDRVFVAMELVDGVTLRRWLKAQPRRWRVVLPISIAAGTGLAAAHAAGLVHRDFKPDNVLVGNDGRVRVMDFGLARMRHSDEPASRMSDANIEARSPLSENLTIAGTLVGTPAYMAPEIYAGAPAGAATDQFAFGVTLFEALFRARPYSRDQLKHVGGGSPRPKIPADTKVPARIQRAVMRAIAIDPAQRFPSMDALLADLALDPFTGRRRALIAGSIVAAGVASVAAVTLLSGSAPEPCRGIDQRLVGVWDAPVKQKIQDAFAATKRPYADKAFAVLASSLDAYMTTWTATSTESCRATRVRRDQTEEVMSLRQLCLDQRLEEVRSLTQLLGEPDPAIVDKAEKIGGELEPLALCSNVAVLRAPGRPSLEVQTKLAPLGKHIADARANMIAGHYLPAMVAAQKAVDLATSVNYEPAKAEALIIRGASLLTTGNGRDAASAYEQASWAALRGRRDELVVGAALMAAMVSVEVLGKPGEAKFWLDLAHATAQRSGLDRVYEQKHFTALGIIAAHGNDNETAVAAHEKAFATAQRNAAAGATDPISVWGDEILLATTLTKARIYTKAVQHFEHAMALREKMVGPDHADIAMILTNLGVDYDFIGEHDKARKAFERAIAIREKAYGPKNPLLIATLNNYADFLKRRREYAVALPVIDRTVAIAEKVPGVEHPLYHRVATTRAEIIGGMGRIAEARKLFDTLLALETRLGSEAQPVTLLARAELELAQKQWAEAARFAERAVAHFEKAGGEHNPELVPALVALGKASLGRGDAATGKPFVERAIAIGKKAGMADAELAFAHEVLASAR